MNQSPKEIFMVRPVNFMFNKETAVTNHYQDLNCSGNDSDYGKIALQEFDDAVKTLKDNNIEVTVVQDTPYFIKPDAIFPNNWISVHQTGEVILYPMATSNRRLERRQDLIQWFIDNFKINKIIDLTEHENDDNFLEGTGSIVFDYQSRVAYACESVRTNDKVLTELCNKLNFEKFLMEASDKQGRPIYHTNVFLSVTSTLAVVCLDALNENIRQKLVNKFEECGKKIVDISQNQVENLAGNCYEVIGLDGKNKLVISTRAWSSLSQDQKDILSESADIVQCRIDTIEKVGGGGIRCMMAGIFADRK